MIDEGRLIHGANCSGLTIKENQKEDFLKALNIQLEGRR